MALPAIQQIDESEPAPVRRFGSADLARHGGWIIKRLTQAFPHQSERSLAGWLRGIVNDNSSLFLYQDDGVALFQSLCIYSLEHKPWVIERFVFAKEGRIKEAAEFYVEAEKWAKGMGVEQLIVEQLTDIPHEVIKDKLGRLYTRQQIFARL